MTANNSVGITRPWVRGVVRTTTQRVAAPGNNKRAPAPRLPATRSVDRCCSFDCLKTGRIYEEPGIAVVRFRVGYVVYDDGGTGFSTDTPLKFGNGNVIAYAHAVCAIDANVDLRDFRTEVDFCHVCREQFFCMRPPEETAILVEHGSFERSNMTGTTVFRPAKFRATFHWGCVDSLWAPELFENLFP